MPSEPPSPEPRVTAARRLQASLTACTSTTSTEGWAGAGWMRWGAAFGACYAMPTPCHAMHVRYVRGMWADSQYSS
jgi:hypothetical protein